MGHRRLAIRNRRAGWGCLRWQPCARRCWRRWPRRRAQPSAVTIDGARSLADKVAVQFKKSKDRTTDVHLLAWNDFHGNLEAGAGLNIYGQFAGGAAWLAKAVHDKQALYGDKQISVHRRRQHRRQPARRRTLLRRAVHDRHQPDECRLRFGRQPRVRQGLGRAPADPERRLPSRRRMYGGALRARRWRHDRHLSRAPTSSTCRPTSCATTTGRRCSPPTGRRGSRATAARSSRSASSARCSRQRPRSSPRPAWPASPSRTRPTPPTASSSNSRRKGVNTSVLVIHQGGFQSGAAAL